MIDKRNGTVETVLNGVTYTARFYLSDGKLHLNVDGYGKTASPAIPNVSIETNAAFFLRQFVRSLGTQGDDR